MPRGRLDWSGPRLPKAPPSPPKDEIGDHSQGAGPYCSSCGVSPTPGNKVITGRWGYLGFRMDLNLCERCVRYFHRAPDPDPLTLDEVA